MSEWEMLDDGAFNGVRKYIRAGTDDDSVDVRHEFHGTQEILDANKADANDSFDRKSDMWHVARIPIEVMYEWLQKYGVNAWKPEHQGAVKKLLNDSEYRYLKIKNVIL